MTPARGLLLAIWTLTIASEATLAYILAFRPGRKTYPAFNVFVNFCLARSLVLYAINLGGNHVAYFYVYYVGVILESIIKAFVMLEIFRELFWPVDILPDDTYGRICTSVAFITLACVASSVLFPSKYPHLLLASSRVADRTLTFMICALSWAIAFYTLRLGIPWRKRLLGLALGFGFDSTVNSIALSLGTSVGRHDNLPVKIAIVCSGFVAMSIWSGFFLLSEPKIISACKPLSLNGIAEKARGCLNSEINFHPSELD